MRVLQLIDSLRPGGAEKMAISYANALVSRLNKSFLCSTRFEGSLKAFLLPEVGYYFLEKKSSIDYKALIKLRHFLIRNRIDIIHAHGDSIFLAAQIKLTMPGLKVIWHDHLGERALRDLSPGFLKPVSILINGVISVNEDLKSWAEKKLYCKKVICINNFLPAAESFTSEPANLRGEGTSFKIVCIANLRPEKDHLTLVKSFHSLIEENYKVTLHIIGKDKNDDYSSKIKQYLSDNSLREKVFFYGEQSLIDNFLQQADLGVLSSKTEGLPVALLEYGRAGLPVVCTRVGAIANVVGEFARLVPPENSTYFANEIKFYLNNPEKRIADAFAFKQRINTVYSEEKVIQQSMKFYFEVYG